MAAHRIALLADFPRFMAEPQAVQEGWHYAVWLTNLFEAFSCAPQYEIHWVKSDRTVRQLKTVQRGGQFFHFVPCGSLTLAQRLHYWPDTLRLHRLLRQIQPDIVHAWGSEHRYATVAARYRRARRMISMQGVISALVQRAPMLPFFRRQQRFEAAALPQVELITSESAWGCARCRELAPQVPALRWEYAAESRFFSVQRQLSAQPTCLMAGTDMSVKNWEGAIHAFSDVRLRGVTLLMAGIEPGRFGQLPPNIRALGGVSRGEIARLLSSVWALVHPSWADTSPNIVKEARVVGVPAVVSCECGGVQYVQQGKSGFIAPPGDTEALIHGVLSLTADAETSLRMGAVGQEECRRALSPETMQTRLFALYDALLQGRIRDLL